MTGNYEFTNNSTASNLRQLGWATLSDRRAIGKLKMLYKATSGLADIPTSDLIPTAPGTRRGSDEEYRIPYSRVNAHLHSYFPCTLCLWNSLPNWIRGCPDVLLFGLYLEKHWSTSKIMFMTKSAATQLYFYNYTFALTNLDTLKLKSVKKRKRHHMFIKVDLRNVHCVSCGIGKIANVGFARVRF